MTDASYVAAFVLFFALCGVAIWAAHRADTWRADQPHIPTPRNHEED